MIYIVVHIQRSTGEIYLIYLLKYIYTGYIHISKDAIFLNMYKQGINNTLVK